MDKHIKDNFYVLFAWWAWWHRQNSLSMACHPNSGKALVGFLVCFTLIGASFIHTSSLV